MPKMSRNDAVTLAKDLRNMGINDDGIRSRLTGEGFSYSEASDVISGLPKRKNDDNQFSNGYKRKNDYQYPVERFERGGCLTAWLSFQAFATFASFFLVCAAMGQVSNDASGGILVLIFVIAIVGIIQLTCIAWLWDGQRKGYQGIIAIYLVGIVINLLAGQFASIGTSILGIIIIYSLVNSKEHLLE